MANYTLRNAVRNSLVKVSKSTTLFTPPEVCVIYLQLSIYMIADFKLITIQKPVPDTHFVGISKIYYEINVHRMMPRVFLSRIQRRQLTFLARYFNLYAIIEF